MTAAPSITGWRAQVQRLAPLELPLLPCGAGSEFKAPMDLKTGRPMAQWQQASFTAYQIIASPPRVRSVGARTGNGFLCFDVDGATAVALGVEQGCDPHQAQTWRVERDTDTNRLKVMWRLTAEQQMQLGAANTKAHTRHPNRCADGKPINGDKGEAVEVFHNPGRQVVVLGEHVPSGGNYLWPDGNGPEALAPIPPAWWEMALAIVRGDLGIGPEGRRATTPATTTTTTRASKSSRAEWAPTGTPADPCPICGRNTSGYCSRNKLSHTIRCFHGSTFHPEISHGIMRRPGQKVTGSDGVIYGFCSIQSHANGDAFSVFKVHEERPEPDHTVGFRDEVAARRAAKEQEAQAQGGAQHQSDEAQPQPLAKTKRHTLAPDEVMVQLPARLGQPRLNIRTNEFHCGSNTYSADDVGRLYLHLSGEAERWPKDTTADALVELAKHHAFDPVEEYLNRVGGTVAPLPMEQWQRLDQHLLGIDDPIAAKFLPQYLISAVARVYRPGCSVRRTLVLITAQWRGKTLLGQILFGEAHWIESVTDLDKDDLMRVQSAWGVELSELNGITRRKDQESLKTFLTAKQDAFRAPYGKGVVRYDRRCVFWGTSNGPPLRDLSGSSRFVCVPLPDRMLPLDWAIEHRDALWSRAVEQFRQIAPDQEPWDRASEEERAAVAERNSNYQETDPWAEEVARHLQAATDRPVSAAYILDRMDIPKSQRNNAMAARVRQLAEAIGWVMERRSMAGERRMGFWPPEPTIQPPAKEAAAIALPHLPQPCHSAATPADAS